ncbi:MAG: hypothetical protein WCO65_02200 [bacterium]
MKNKIFISLGIFAVIEITNICLYLYYFKNEMFLIKWPLAIALAFLASLFYFLFIFRSRNKKDFILEDVFKCISIVDCFAGMLIFTSLTFGQQICAILIPVVIIGLVYVDFLSSIPETNEWFKWMNKKE